jgi:class I fructose-bisphosphate aldolase
VPYSGDPDSFARALRACPVPVLVAGGPRKENFKGFLDMIQEAMGCGARGVSIGRNIFQHKTPDTALKELAAAVRG